MTWEIDLPLVADGRPLSLNHRHHPIVRNRMVQEIRKAAGWGAVAAKIGRHRHVSVQLHYRPGDARRRDTENLVASQKPAVDGVVDAGVIPDDTPRHLTWQPPQIHDGPGPRRLWLEITTQEAACAT